MHLGVGEGGPRGDMWVYIYIYTHTHIADSLGCYMAEANTTL